jgi:hypothetical protein
MKLWLKILIGLMIAGIIAGFLVYKFLINKHQPDYEKLKPEYSLDAGAFYREFKVNPDNAHKLYNGKMVQLSGKLSKIENTDSLAIAVFVFNQGLFGDEGVRCTVLKKFNAEVKKLKPDGIIRIKGVCSGFTGTDVIVEHCSLIY